MPKLRLAVALVVCLAAPSAWARTITLPLSAGARVQVSKMMDGFTVGLLVRGIDAPTLQRHLEALHPQTIEMLAPGGKEAVAYMRFGDRVTIAQAALAHHGAKGKRTLAIDLTVETQTGREALLARSLSGPLPLPASLDAQLLKEADHHWLEGHIAQAELQLEQLRKNYPLHAWVMLRLGDVAVHKQEIETACEYYAETSREGLERTASVLALLRARVLGCPADIQPPWEKLLSRDALDDPVGRRIAEEAAWALDYELDLPTLHKVRNLSGHSYDRTINRDLRRTLTARLFHFETPLGVATLAEQGSMLVGHPEAFDLDLVAGRAWCLLDSPKSWKQRSSQASTWMKLSDKERHRWQEQASACKLATLPPLHLAAQNNEPLAPEQHLQNLRRRLAAASREVANQFEPKERPHAPKTVAEADAQGATDAPPDPSAMPNKEQR